MGTLLGASWKTTVAGLVAGVALYFTQIGVQMPTTSKEWGTAFVSAMLFAWGRLQKDANVTNAAVPTAARPVE